MVFVDHDVEVSEYALFDNYPNPFNPTTTITYQIPESTPVKLEVFNLKGQRVALLVDEVQSKGHYTAYFDASSLSSGVYLYRITTLNFVQSNSMILLK